MSAPIDDTEVQRLAAAVGLTLDLALRGAVAQQLLGLLAAARLVDEFVIPETTEPAPEFEP
jgi:1-carboxybiuret hydrolase subunit AtzG-like protein